MFQQPTQSNAKIVKTTLGFEDHGIFTFMLDLDYGSTRQGFGNYALSHEYGVFVIKEILKVVGVERWEDLPGKHIRVDRLDSQIQRIGNLLHERWLSHDDICKDATDVSATK